VTLVETWVQTPLAQAIGWTLFHSLWEGAVVALALAAAFCAIRSSRTRYALACLAMLTMLAGFGFTLARAMPQAQDHVATIANARGAPLPAGFEEPWLAAKSLAQRSAADFLPWLAPFWIAGVAIFHLRSLASWMAARRLRRTGICFAPDHWRERLDRLGAQLRLSRPVTLLESCLAEVPVVIGYVRPAILMPVGLFAGLPAGQIESILLHELAHIRRYDYLVNLLQTSVEGVLFYHPAVWWISGLIRAERENCCDDLVVATQGDAREYAAALATLEQNRWSAREAAPAATGGNLMKRIRRLLDQPESPRAALTPIFSAGVLAITAAVVLTAWQSKPGDKAPAPAASAAPAAPAAQAQAPQVSPPPATPSTKWLQEDVAYIITDQERAAYKRLATDEEREHFIEQFWLRRDPTPGTPENEFKEEHYRRIAYANQHYAAAGISGWKTDRGRIYITYGPADEIESHPSGGASTHPFEQWRYRFIEGMGTNIIIEFVDSTRTGEYRMTLDPSEKDALLSLLGPSGGHVFASTEPGSRVTVAITSDRRMLVRIPIDFEAQQYEITGRTRRSDTGAIVKVFQNMLTLCKIAPGTADCLERPEFQPGVAVTESATLEPGSYVFEATVKDRAGTIQKTYTVNFSVE
jgi:GWxTD domain-containing protein